MNFEGRHVRAGRLPGGQDAVQHRQRADALEDGQNTVAGGRAQPLLRQIAQPVFHFAAPDAVQPPGAEGRGKALPGNALVHPPAPLAKPDMRQVDGGDKGIEPQYGGPRAIAPPGVSGRAACGGVLRTVLGHAVFSCKRVMGNGSIDREPPRESGGSIYMVLSNYWKCFQNRCTRGRIRANGRPQSRIFPRGRVIPWKFALLY